MTEDIAGQIHRDKCGRSDKVNAPENQSHEFRDGYRAGVETLGHEAVKMINEEGPKSATIWAKEWPNACVASGQHAVRWLRLESKSEKDDD